MSNNNLKFSIVIPVYNEEKNIPFLYDSIRKVMGNIMEGGYEIIFVNDGSQDETFGVLNTIASESSDLIIVNLNKHRGQSIAMQAGFDIAKGGLIITMDGDLQNDPVDIPALFYKMKEGYDIVCGWRYKRNDSGVRMFLSIVSSVIRRIIFRETIHDPGCTLRIFKKEVLRNVFMFNGAHRFFTLIMVKLGYKVGEIKVVHHRRKFGKSKYSIYHKFIHGIVVFIKFFMFDIHALLEKGESVKNK